MTQQAAVSKEINQDLETRVEALKKEIKDEYREAHKKPWIIGFSGGKDSTLVLHLVIESLLELPWSERKREVHVVANDTLVESTNACTIGDSTSVSFATT